MDKKDIILDLRDRSFASIKKDDFKENKKEEFLFKFFEKNAKKTSYNFNLNIMDTEADSKQVITQQEVQKMLSNKDFQKKNISEEDLIAFLNKLQVLNPTKEEIFKTEIKNNYKDENGDSIMSEEINDMFGFKRTKYEYADREGNVLQGFEIFDLNGDGKIDSVEKDYIAQNNLQFNGDLESLKKYYDTLDAVGSEDGNTTDGIITKADMQKMYDILIENYNNKMRETLENLGIKTVFNENVITKEVLALFNETTSINASDIVGDNGRIKDGLEIFDLNNDRKFDDIEMNYFSSGGHPLSDDKEISIENLIESVRRLDGFETIPSSSLSTFENKKINLSDKYYLYKMLEGANYIVENVEKFPSELQPKILTGLKEVLFVQNSEKMVQGVNVGNKIGVANAVLKQKGENAAVIMHELTHYILDKNKVPALLQEIETFYMEYKLYKNSSNEDKKYFYEKDDPYKKHCIIDNRYEQKVEELRRQNPNISEQELALAGFIESHFSGYNGQYGPKISEEELRQQYFALGDKSLLAQYYPAKKDM